ncbi:MAG TPA: hypothetical protein PLD12_08525 [Bacteroidales bacterium]|nr:hypothetical protein [Bacteroidales bacterium]HPO65035.1 hypothetical protein [Bacteroidales bacterium]
MPYRRLPNTDAARLKAMRTAYQKGKELPPFKLAFSQATFQKLQSFLPILEKNIAESRFTYENQIKKSKEYQQYLRKARIYISHFLQVMNMAIERGELPASTRTFFGLNEDDTRLPSLNSDEALLQWGENILQGEQERMRRGLSPITNPTVALVRVRFERFKDAYLAQKTMKKNTSRYFSELPNLRKTADELIAQIWDEVEEHFKDLPDEKRRAECSNYGIVYVFRKNELDKISLPLSQAVPQVYL